MAQKKEKGFTVIGEIQAETVVAAISDRSRTQTCVTGETKEILNAYRMIVRSLAASLTSSVVDEKQDQAESIITAVLLKETARGVMMHFTSKDEEEE